MALQAISSWCVHHRGVSLACTGNLWSHTNPCRELWGAHPTYGPSRSLLAPERCTPVATGSPSNVNPKCSRHWHRFPKGTTPPRWPSCPSQVRQKYSLGADGPVRPSASCLGDRGDAGGKRTQSMKASWIPSQEFTRGMVNPGTFELPKEQGTGFCPQMHLQHLGWQWAHNMCSTIVCPMQTTHK